VTAPYPIVENEDDLTAAVDALAHENADRLATMTERQQHRYVRRSIRVHEVVFVIWEEDENQHHYQIKERGRLGRLSSTAFFVRGRADAIGMAEEMGDGAPHLAHDMPRMVQ
jgi:hypothetical protein